MKDLSLNTINTNEAGALIEYESMDCLPVEIAFLHQAILWPGKLRSETTLSQLKSPGIKMMYTKNGLVLEHKGGKAIVPLANVSIAILK